MSHFKDFYRSGSPVFSFEVFPPKTEKGVENLFVELERLQKIQPAFVSVTYGALGTTRDLTKDLAVNIQNKLGMRAAFHFTCVGSGREEIRDYVIDLAKQGIELVVALRGDKPAGMQSFVPPVDGFKYANELVAYLKNLHPFSMAVAGYPEKHVEAKSLEEDLTHLKGKVDAGADVILTQLFFDNRDYFSYVKKVRALGVQVPIIPGILPIQSLKQIRRITDLCGAHLPDDLRIKLEACGEDENRMIAVGIAHATEQCRDLLKQGVPGIHFYSLNKANPVLEILNNCDVKFPK